jgi:hypothetical protein
MREAFNNPKDIPSSVNIVTYRHEPYNTPDKGEETKET